MAEFCVQCSWEMGFRHDEFKGLTDRASFLKGLAAVVMCEGCGAIQVDPDGNCLGDCRIYLDRPPRPMSHECPHCRPAPLWIFHRRQVNITFIMCPFHFEHVDG